MDPKVRGTTNADITLTGGQVADLMYSGTLSRWIVTTRGDLSGVSANLVKPTIGGGSTITKILRGTVVMEPANIGANTVSSQTFTLKGALTGDTLVLNPPAAGLPTGLLVVQVYVSATDTITVVFDNTTGRAIHQVSGSWTYRLER